MRRPEAPSLRHACRPAIGGAEMTIRRCAGNVLAVLIWSLMAVAVSAQALAQGCRPVAERVGEQGGCWILADESLGLLPQTPLFWHLVNYPTRAEAGAAKGPRGSVFEAFGKIWLSTIAEAGWQAPRGAMRVAEVGPIPGISNEAYTAITRNRAILWASQQIYTDMTGLNFFIPWPGNYVWKPLMA